MDKEKIPTWDETEEISSVEMSDTPSWDETEDIESIVNQVEQPINNQLIGRELANTMSDTDTNVLESLGAGTAQGLTLDFADELYGGGRAALDKLLGEEQPYSDIYKERRDEAREYFNKAAKENPIAYGIGEYGIGGILPAMATGGTSAMAKAGAKGAVKAAEKVTAKELAKAGAKFGAISGAGRSTEEDVTGIAKDVVMGAGTGAIASTLMGTGLEKVKNIAGYLNDLPSVQKIKDVYNAAKSGKSTFDKNAAEIVRNETDNLINNFSSKLSDLRQTAGKGISESMKEADQSVSIILKMDDIQKMIDDFNPRNPEQDRLKIELQNILNNTKQEEVVEKLVPKRFVENPVDVAEKNLQKKIDTYNTKAEMVGEPSNIQQYGRDTDTELLTAFDTTKGTPLTIPIKQGVSTPLKIDKTIEQVDVPGFKPSDLQEVYGRFKDLYPSYQKDPISGKQIVQTYKNIDEQLTKGLPEDIAEKYSQSKQLFSDVRQIDDLLDSKADLSNIDLNSIEGQQLKNRISKFIRGVEGQGEAGIANKENLEIIQSKLKSVFPEQEANDIISKIQDVSARANLIKESKTQLNFTRDPMQYLLGTIPQTIKRGADIAGKYSQTTGPTRKVLNTVVDMSKKLNKMSQEQAAILHQKALQDPKYNKLAPMLEQLSNPGAKRSSVVFSLSQQPAFREFIRDSLPELLPENED